MRSLSPDGVGTEMRLPGFSPWGYPNGYRPAVAVAAGEEHEREIWSGRPSWRGRMAILVPGVLLTLLVLVVCLWADFSATVTLVAVVVVGLVTIVWAFLETIRWKYTITNRRVFVRHG